MTTFDQLREVGEILAIQMYYKQFGTLPPDNLEPELLVKIINDKESNSQLKELARKRLSNMIESLDSTKLRSIYYSLDEIDQAKCRLIMIKEWTNVEKLLWLFSVSSEYEKEKIVKILQNMNAGTLVYPWDEAWGEAFSISINYSGKWLDKLKETILQKLREVKDDSSTHWYNASTTSSDPEFMDIVYKNLERLFITLQDVCGLYNKNTDKDMEKFFLKKLPEIAKDFSDWAFVLNHSDISGDWGKSTSPLEELAMEHLLMLYKKAKEEDQLLNLGEDFGDWFEITSGNVCIFLSHKLGMQTGNELRIIGLAKLKEFAGGDEEKWKKIWTNHRTDSQDQYMMTLLEMVEALTSPSSPDLTKDKAIELFKLLSGTSFQTMPELEKREKMSLVKLTDYLKQVLSISDWIEIIQKGKDKSPLVILARNIVKESLVK